MAASKQASIHTHVRNVVMLVWGSLRLAPITDCKDEGNILKSYLPEKNTVVVFKTLMFEHVWVPSLVHPRIIKLCLPLTSHT